MPIYAYRCSECGHAKDVLQKMSDPVLTDCPACGAQTFVKQVTAAGFQLKGSGWYVTDFKGGNAAPKPAEGAKGESEKGEPAKVDAATGEAPKLDVPKGDGPKPQAAPAPASKTDGRAAKPASVPTPAVAPASAPKGGAPASGG
jgi:putative FmdB family regulatory protein